MTDRILSPSVQNSVACAQLPGRETAVARPEMMNISGGLTPNWPGPIMPVIVMIVAEAIIDYFGNGD